VYLGGFRSTRECTRRLARASNSKEFNDTRGADIPI